MYLDPGFGGILLQFIIALVAFGGALLFAFRRKIKKIFSKRKENVQKPIMSNHLEANDGDVIDIMETHKDDH